MNSRTHAWKPENLPNYVDTDDPHKCWNWQGCLDSDGYGRYSGYTAHRVVWESMRGPIEPLLELDHLCRNRACVNPDHLEPVDRLTNISRSLAVCVINARKTHCVNGHAFSLENTYVWTNKRGAEIRHCRTCNRENAARSKAKRKDGVTQ